MRSPLRELVPLVALLALGCSSVSTHVSDGSVGDGGGFVDAGLGDAQAIDSGSADSGADDAGTVAGDAGDAGDLAPMNPACLEPDAGEECWDEWLKRTETPEFKPVGVGERGAGPWPTDDVVVFSSGEGISGDIRGVGTDVDGNIYAVSPDSFFLWRVGEVVFTEIPRGTGGLREDRLLSVAGAGPGIAYIGYEGRFGVDPDNEPVEVRKSGDVQKIRLNAVGFDATTFDTHNSNTPISGKFDHSRSIFNMVVPRRGPAAGELYLGTEHGIVRYQSDTLYADHRHIATVVAGSQRFGATGALTVTDDGTLWYGNDFAFGGLGYTRRLFEWYGVTPWLFPSHAFGAPETRNNHEGIAVDAAGDVWVAARGFGLAHLDTGPRGRFTLETLPLPDDQARDLVIDLDGSMWLAADGGLYRGSADGRTWQRQAGVPGPVFDLFLDDVVTPRTVWAAHRGGITALRGR